LIEGIEMIEYLGFINVLGKDIKEYYALKEETKLVDREWLDRSGFKHLMASKGYELRW
jgi:hypothetical protein